MFYAYDHDKRRNTDLLQGLGRRHPGLVIFSNLSPFTKLQAMISLYLNVFVLVVQLFLIQQARLVDINVDGVVIKGKGHWLMEEAPSEVIPRLVAFINKSR
jgi:pimeloyl-ACP methyl ester carboxylesterase